MFLSGTLLNALAVLAVGGLLIIGVGLRLLRIRDVGVADFLPAILVAPLLVALADAAGRLIRP